MNDIWKLLSGRKTYIIGWVTLGYIIVQYLVNKQPVEQEVILAALAAMGITIRSGVKAETTP